MLSASALAMSGTAMALAMAYASTSMALTATTRLTGNNAGEFGERCIQRTNLCGTAGSSIQNIVITCTNRSHTALLLEICTVQGHCCARTTTLLLPAAATLTMSGASAFTVALGASAST
jgi:hypothetical protein